MAAITPLQDWIRKKVGMGLDRTDARYLKGLRDYQLERLSKIIDYARCNTPFYNRHLAELPPGPMLSLSEISRIPFTYPSDVVSNPADFLAVRQDDIARIVTLRTSGSTGESKRLFFTEEDLELTVDFFHHGMSTIVRPGQKVMVFLPGQRPDSVGDLLLRGLGRMDVRALVYGPIEDPLDAVTAIDTFGADCLVGIPTQILAAACWSREAGMGEARIESVLLSTDYVPESIVSRLREIWGCRVFNHYGMTETGLGGGVECEALDGYHLREADLYFEVVDHASGKTCPVGTPGEVVFTTLTRKGMPLIRYRTGDISRILPGVCPCGSVLRRMERIRGRWDGLVNVGPGHTLCLPDMDEALFALPGLIDYRVTASKRRDRVWRLQIDAKRMEGTRPTGHEILQRLQEIAAIRKGIAEGYLEISAVRFSTGRDWMTTGVAKRRIITVQE